MAKSSLKRREPSKDTVRLHSSDADEIFCQPCGLEGSFEVAVGFCQNCEEYFCRSCINYHRKQRITKQHEILGKDKMPKGRGVIVREECDIMCDKHPTVIVKFYCTIHKNVGCSECVVLEHAECNHTKCVKDIQELSEDFIASEVDFDAFHKNMETLQTELDKVEYSLDSESESAIKSNSLLENAIRTLKLQLYSRLDLMEIELIKEAGKLKLDDENALKGLKDNTATIKDEIENTKKQFDANVHQKKSMFVLTMQAERKLAKMEEDLTRIKSRRQLRQYKFVPSSDVKDLLAGNISLGNITDVKTEEFTAKFIRDVNVRTSTDSNHCCPAGIAMVCPKRMVIGESNNKTLKLVDLQTGSVLSTCDVTSSPKDIAALSETQIAATFPKEKKIKLYDIVFGGNIIVNKELRVNGKCEGIAHKANKLAISYDNSGKIEILNTIGHVVHTIIPKQKTGDLFKGPRYMVFGHEKDTLVVSDNDTSQVSIVTFQGEILKSFTIDKLKTPRGITVAADGTVMVASCANNCVHIIASDFKTSRTLLQEDTSVRYPECICFDESSNTLLLWCSTLGDKPNIDNVIKMFQLS